MSRNNTGTHNWELWQRNGGYRGISKGDLRFDETGKRWCDIIGYILSMKYFRCILYIIILLYKYLNSGSWCWYRSCLLLHNMNVCIIFLDSRSLSLSFLLIFYTLFCISTSIHSISSIFLSLYTELWNFIPTASPSERTGKISSTVVHIYMYGHALHKLKFGFGFFTE